MVFPACTVPASGKKTSASYLLPSIIPPNYGNISTSNEGLNLYQKDDEKSYYYRGKVENNYVSFANKIWRIIKINSDNSIKIILEQPSTYMKYSENNEYADYTGLRYIYNDQTVDNNITEYLNNWYKENITDKGLDSYVMITSFCNDSNNFKNGYQTLFNGYSRLVSNKQPSLICDKNNNDFGGTYIQKVGLITADEVSLAGGVYNQDNTDYYLYNKETFATITPFSFNIVGYRRISDIFTVDSNGKLTSSHTTDEIGIRPVISLDPTLTVTGDGTIDRPYIIDLDE